jgi:hypothetical protein
MTQDLDAVASNLVADEAPSAPLVAAVERRVRIILEENEQIPPTGQFFGVQGKGYVLRAGEEADVPLSIIGILNTAVMSVPVKDQGDRVMGFRERLRFPYRVCSDLRPT